MGGLRELTKLISLSKCKIFKGEQIRKPVAFPRKATANVEEADVYMRYCYLEYLIYNASLVMLSWFLDSK